MKIILPLTAAAVSFSPIASSQTERDLDSHVHGAAALNVAVVDSSVLMEFQSPWNNLVGFEHAPQSEEQHALVDSALTLLNEPEQLFAFNGGGCQFNEVVVENSMSDSDEHHDDHDAEHDDDHKDEHDDDHDAEHDDDHKDEHGDDHDAEHDDDHKDEHGDEHADAHKDEHDHDGDHEEPTHSTVLATYTYQCEQTDQLTSIELSLFSVWPRLEDLDVQMIGESGQTSLELNPQETVLMLDQIQ